MSASSPRELKKIKNINGEESVASSLNSIVKKQFTNTLAIKKRLLKKELKLFTKTFIVQLIISFQKITMQLKKILRL